MDLKALMEAATRMQSQMSDAQSRLDGLTSEGKSGAGLVSATVSAAGKVMRLSIDPSLFKAEDKEVVEDLIVAAINDGLRKAAEQAQKEMGKITADLPLPPGFKMPF